MNIKLSLPRAAVLSAGLLASLIVLFAGCATQVGKAAYPKAAEGFVPKKVYSASFDKVWDSTNQALEENRIATTSSDKTAGRITTDYVQGPSELYALGTAGSAVWRYKYNVVQRTESEKTKVTVLCTLEYSYSDGSVAKPFRDYSKDSPNEVAGLENWLYEQIEKKL